MASDPPVIVIDGKAYDLSGRKWSRSGRLPAILAWLLILTMAAIVIATLMSEVL